MLNKLDKVLADCWENVHALHVDPLDCCHIIAHTTATIHLNFVS